MKNIPKIIDVTPSKGLSIRAVFDNGIAKEYNVKPLMKKYPVFKRLKDKAIFNLVHVDCGGYGIAWDDNIDLSEYEIWTNGVKITRL